MDWVWVCNAFVDSSNRKGLCNIHDWPLLALFTNNCDLSESLLHAYAGLWMITSWYCSNSCMHKHLSSDLKLLASHPYPVKKNKFFSVWPKVFLRTQNWSHESWSLDEGWENECIRDDVNATGSNCRDGDVVERQEARVTGGTREACWWQGKMNSRAIKGRNQEIYKLQSPVGAPTSRQDWLLSGWGKIYTMSKDDVMWGLAVVIQDFLEERMRKKLPYFPTEESWGTE